MARINNLKNFCEDIASAIKSKKGIDTSTKIKASNFDSEILGIKLSSLGDKNISIQTNGTSTYKATNDSLDGYSEVTITTDVVPNLQSKSVTPTTETQTINADSSYDGLLNVTVSAIETETKTVNPAASDITVIPSENKFLSKVTVNKVDNTIDSNIQASNIKKNVSILGITGTYEGEELMNVEITPTTQQQVLNHPNSYGYDEITVKGVTNSIDNNIKPENIKKNISILGITGTYDNASSLITKTITKNGIYSASDDNSDGYSQITVNVPSTGETVLKEFSGFSGLYGKIETDDNKVTINTENSIFVAPTGTNATGNGTYTNPYKTISYALNQANAGDTIYVRAGTYTNLVINKSGTENNPITIRNYPNEEVILDCTNLTVDAVVDFNYQSYVNIIGFTLKNLTQINDSVFGVLFRGGEKHCSVVNCDINNIKGSSAGSGNANGIKVAGLSETGACEYILIQNNHIHDCVCGWSEALTVTANSQYIDVINNKVHDNGNIGIDIAGNFGDCSNAALDHARYVYVAYNEVYNCNSNNADCAGLYVDGASLVFFNGNKSYNNQIGLEIGAEMSTSNENYMPHNNFAFNNLIYNNSVRQVALGGWSDTESGKTFNSNLYNNTIINPSTADDSTILITAGEGFYFVNNIVLDLGTWNYFIRTEFNNSVTSNIDFENNLMYFVNNADLMEDGIYIYLLDTAYNTDSFLSTFGNSNIITADYNLNIDYTLMSNSPAINKGKSVNFDDFNSLIPNISDIYNYDFNKNLRVINENIDIGCYEYQSFDGRNKRFL